MSEETERAYYDTGVLEEQERILKIIDNLYSFHKKIANSSVMYAFVKELKKRIKEIKQGGER